MANTLNSLLLLSTPVVAVIGAIGGLVIGAGVVAVIFLVINKAKAKSVNDKIEKMYSDADLECKKMRKEAALEAKEQDLKLRNDFERDTKEKRIELQKMEQRLNQKDELLNKKDSNLLKKNEELEQQKRELDKKVASINQKQEKIDKEFESVVAKLEEISGLTKEEAKQQLSDSILDETRREVAVQVRSIEQEAKEDADKKAKDIKIIDIHEVSVIADYFVIASASNQNQVQAMVDNADEMLGRAGYEAKQIEGTRNSSWVLMDYGDMIIHIFDEENRLFYDLERIWRDGKILDAEEFLGENE